MLIFISVILALIITDLDRKNLINSVCHPDKPEKFCDTFSLRYSSNIITSAGLVFFYCVAKKNFFNNKDPDSCSPAYNYVSSTLVLFAGFIRLYDILYNQFRDKSDSTQEDEDIPDTDIDI